MSSIPRGVQYILESILHPTVCTSRSPYPSVAPPATTSRPPLVTTSLFSISVSFMQHLLCARQWKKQTASRVLKLTFWCNSNNDSDDNNTCYQYSLYLLNTYYVPGTVLSKYVLTCFPYVSSLNINNLMNSIILYFSYLTDKNTEVRTEEAACPRSQGETRI